jgi:[ribosomal protein S5]-alanine N-acetyltransferase
MQTDNPPTKISTSRLNLKLIAHEDCDFMCALVNTQGWLAFIGDRNIHSKNDAAAYISRLLNTENLFYWVVGLKESDIPIGIVSFLKRAYLDSYDIGFAFLPEFGGNGYAYEAASETLKIVSQNPAYKPILATTVPANEKSIKLLVKLGFRFEREIELANEKLHIYAT